MKQNQSGIVEGLLIEITTVNSWFFLGSVWGDASRLCRFDCLVIGITTSKCWFLRGCDGGEASRLCRFDCPMIDQLPAVLAIALVVSPSSLPCSSLAKTAVSESTRLTAASY